MKEALIALVCLAAGIGLGFSLGAASASKNSEPAAVVTNEAAQQKLQALSEKELVEYYQLKDQKAKYEKADELLGKMVAIFVADLGLKLSRPLQEAQRTHNTEKGMMVAESEVGPGAPTPPLADLTSSPTPPPPTQPRTLTSRPPLEDVRNEQDIQAFLEQSKIENIDQAIQSSTDFDNQELAQEINGTFGGSASVTNKDKPTTWEIEYSLRGRMRDSKLQGNYRLRLIENGKQFSNKSGRGGLDESFREISSDPNAILVEASPEIYLQVYYSKQTDMMFGNVLQKPRKRGPYTTIGTFILNRR